MNRIIPSLLLLVGIAALPLFRPGSAHGDAAAKARRWKVIVIIPERHLARPRIPDPAAETEICRQLIDAGYKVIDQDRIADLRYSAVEDRILKGGPESVKDILQLRRKFGADLFITGEAFSQEVSRQQRDTDLGPVTEVLCRARVELKGIRMDTAEKFYSDAIQKTGAPDLTEELASKICLQQAAEDMSESLLKKLDGLALSSDQHVELEVRGIASLSLANQLEAALGKITGVLDVEQGDFDAHTYSTEISIKKAALRSFASQLETAPALKRFHLTVQSSNGSKIIVNSR